MAKKAKIKKPKQIWLIAYINPKLANHIVDIITSNPKFVEIYPYIPMLKMLNKRFKGKEIFNEVPLTFNYGFFKMPKAVAENRALLNELISKCEGMTAWVKDYANAKAYKKKYRTDDSIPIARATKKEIQGIVNMELANSLFSRDELAGVKIGQMIVLKQYPFENLSATVESIDYDRRKVTVSVLGEAVLFQHTEVDFENVFYSIYRDFDPEISTSSVQSLDELKERNTNHKAFRYHDES